MRFTRVSAALLLFAGAGAGQVRVNADAAISAAFQNKVAEYVKLRKTAEAGLPQVKPGDGGFGIPQHQVELAGRIREARGSAKQGDICSPEVAGELRRLIGLAMQGANSKRILRSLRHAEPIALKIAVNGSLPEKLPLQSTPPTLLMNLPKLPPEVDYRVIGNALVLRDTGANMVIDYVPDALPATP